MIVLCLSASAQTAKPALPPPVAAVVEAYGGIEALKKHRDAPLRSHLTMDTYSQISAACNSYDCRLLERGNRLRADMSMLDVPLIVGYDGKTSWTQYGDWVSPAAPSATEQVSEELHHGLRVLADIEDPSVSIALLPDQSVQGRACDVFKMTSSDGRTDTFYADKQTHLIVRDDYAAVDHELGVTSNQSVEYSDYRPAAGSLEPFHVVQYSGGRKKSETIVLSVEVDPTVDDAAFRMPPESSMPELERAPVAIPFEYVGNQIVVKARINNGSEQRFMIDTGASQSVVDESAASALGPHPSSTFSITAGSRAVPLGYSKISTLSLGDLTLHDIPVFIKNLGELNDHPSGLIGANILRRFLVTVDFDTNTITLADPRNAAPPANAVVVPAVSVFGATALVVKARVDNKGELNCLVDTGASFNNVPQSLAKPFFSGPINPVGIIFGLDGRRLNIGSIRCQSLDLGGAHIAHPVFTVTPDDGSKEDGLFTAGRIAILGNPIWSRFRTTIDYRNERLFLETAPGQDRLRKLTARLDAVVDDYLLNKSTDKTLKLLEQLLADARAEKQKSAEALILSQIASCYADKYQEAKESKLLSNAAKLFEHASKRANESYDRAVEGRVLAQWALMYLNAPRTMDDIKVAQSLVAKALQKAPMEPSIFAAFGATLLQAGKLEEAEKVLNRALVLDPSNWQALWSKYRLCDDQQRRREQKLVAQQLQRYYPSYPEVMRLSSR